ncbi:glycosyltransferase family 39 protein [Hymenobacter sp. BT770]|uniref:ArnT family glycosyltransferase n=1 Tax=Hymenobacter sp. BT770 TaxID=2886942 RepID=UPI001D11F618|nr:glycosyltransferase family 39 protein [Hymenobacter sp. BT770]MCC3155467.1 glycosyltransferase family 39 protein [Hymenobacter sp. BT770]MDO3417474.1 glycosyltransferase family 39 protein [Hymenobacter sp. BT770]
MELFPEAEPLRARFALLWLGLFLVLLGLGLLSGLNAWGPLESSEARYAEIGREMLASRDWLHPRLLGIQHFHKPPLTYWLTAAGLAMAGPTAAGVRLLPALAVLVQVGLVYGLGLVLFQGDRARALAAAVVYGTLPAVLISALNVTTDVYLATLELAAAYAVLRYYANGRPGWLYLFWLALGLAFLTKGPVGFVLPLMAVAGFYFRQDRPRRPFTVHYALGIGLFLVVGLGWYGYLAAENSAFVRYFLFNHTVERFANPASFGRSKPWWFYWVLAPAVSLPWSAALLAQFVRTPWAALPRTWRNVWVFWVLVPLVFFSLSSSKLLLYVLPVFPGVALLVVYYLGRCPEAVLYRWYLGMGLFFGLMLTAIGVLPMISIRALPLVASPAVGFWAAVGLGALMVQHLLWRPEWPVPRLLVAPAVFTLFLLLAAKTLLHQNELLFNGTRPVAARLLRPHLAGRQVLVYDELLPSLAFELGQIPVSLFDGNDNLRRETQFETDRSWQRLLVNLQDSTAQSVPLVARWARPPLLVVKGTLTPDRQWLRAGLLREEQVGPWRIYYAP